MNSLRVFGVMVLIVVGLAVAATAQDKPSIVTMATSKVATPPGLPACVTTSVQHGNPNTGASVILTKLTAGCFTPWHWHTTNESIVVVSGRAKLEVKGEAAQNVGVGDYFYMPSKHPHQTTCISGSTPIAVLSPVMNAVSLPVNGSICSTVEVPGANGKPLKSVTRSWSLKDTIPVGTASSNGPPTPGKAGFGIFGKAASVENVPVGISTCRSLR